MNKSIRISNGYRLIYDPIHSRAMKIGNWKGYVYEHIFVAENGLGRELRNEEVVHHLDGDKLNNRLENLLVLDLGQHSKLHMWLDYGAYYNYNIKGSGLGCNRLKKELKYCLICGKTLQGSQTKYCSEDCSSIGKRKVVRPSKEDLLKDIENNSICAISKKYLVSDNAIRKWIKKYNIK